LKLRNIKNNIPENSDIKERLTIGLDLTFKKLIKTKSQTKGILVLSQDGMMMKIKVSDLIK